MTSIRALVVDDDPGVRTLVEDEAARDGTASHASVGADGQGFSMTANFPN